MDPDTDDTDDTDAPASPPCYAHEVDPAYMGFAPDDDTAPSDDQPPPTAAG